MDFNIFDNYEEDGQLSMFDMAQDYEELSPVVEEKKTKYAPKQTNVIENDMQAGSGTVKISKCMSCGRILFVKDAGASFSATCNACGVEYIQKK